MSCSRQQTELSLMSAAGNSFAESWNQGQWGCAISRHLTFTESAVSLSGARNHKRTPAHTLLRLRARFFVAKHERTDARSSCGLH
jgi:hypothetical protein